MIKIIFRLWVVSVFAFLTACSIIQKNKCESSNWYSIGENLGASGKYPDQDDFVNFCRKQDLYDSQALDRGFKLGRESYCTYDNFMRLGAAGQPSSFIVCSGLDEERLKKSYESGLKKYCTLENAFRMGMQGEPYKEVCSSLGLSEFKPRYNEGKKIYLKKNLDDLVAKKTELNKQMELAKADYLKYLKLFREKRDSTNPTQDDRMVYAQRMQDAQSKERDLKIELLNLEPQIKTVEARLKNSQ